MSQAILPFRQKLEKMVQEMDPQSVSMGLLLAAPIFNPIVRYVKEKALTEQIVKASENHQLDLFRQRKDVRFITHFTASLQIISAIAFGILFPAFGITMGCLGASSLISGFLIANQNKLPKELEAHLEKKLELSLTH